MNKFSIKKVVRGANNKIIGYELNSGSIVDVDEALDLARNNQLSNVTMIHKDGEESSVSGIGIDVSNLPEIK